MNKNQIFMVLNRITINVDKYIPPEIKSIIYDFAVFKPKTKKEIYIAIRDFSEDRELALKEYGPPNTWDISNILVMDFLFSNTDFNEDISEWDVSGVISMVYMFSNCKFNGDLSRWDVSNVRNMSFMFSNSKFNGGKISDSIDPRTGTSVTVSSRTIGYSTVDDFINSTRTIGSNPCTIGAGISNWNVSNVESMTGMFENSDFDGSAGVDAYGNSIGLSRWKLNKHVSTFKMFYNSRFRGDISTWNLDENTMTFMF